MQKAPLNGLNVVSGGGSISGSFQLILSYLCAKFGDFFKKCTISLKIAHIRWTKADSSVEYSQLFCNKDSK